MHQPESRREGNLRFACLPCDGLPADPWAAHARVCELVGAQEGARTYGPPTIVFDLPPEDDAPSGWRCQVGTAVIGQVRSRPPLLIEDYQGLHALVTHHHGPLRSLAESWRAVVDHARAAGLRPRPYWRLRLRRTRTADDQLLPVAEVSVFLDR